ncbi:acyltransferase family protein [Cytobacillus sp. IB215665]|uniref:acyltransferase family protein n=1 Tax=Cytobacillus sp. IB215665 TaxID=3097357 RepID=UPI0039B78E8D
MVAISIESKQLKKSRDPFFDNAKFILVFLVVFGHLISMFKGNNEFLYLMINFLATFRMPALILIAGYFSKNFYKKGFIQKVSSKTILPYVIFEVLYSYYNFVLYGYESVQLSLFLPTMGMWFLLSMFCWNLMLFIFTKLKYSLVIAFLLGIGIGFFDNAGAYLSVSRTFVFFPFFLIGYYMKAEHFHFAKHKYAKYLSLVLVIICITIIWVADSSIFRMYLLGKYSIDTIGHSLLGGTLYRIIIYFIMLCGICSFLPWVTKKQVFFTSLGKRTAYVYIFHFFIIKYIKTLDWYTEWSKIHIIIIPFFAIIITLLLSSKPFISFTRPLVEYKFSLTTFKKPLDYIKISIIMFIIIVYILHSWTSNRFEKLLVENARLITFNYLPCF